MFLVPVSGWKIKNLSKYEISKVPVISHILIWLVMKPKVLVLFN